MNNPSAPPPPPPTAPTANLPSYPQTSQLPPNINQQPQPHTNPANSPANPSHQGPYIPQNQASPAHSNQNLLQSPIQQPAAPQHPSPAMSSTSSLYDQTSQQQAPMYPVPGSGPQPTHSFQPQPPEQPGMQTGMFSVPAQGMQHPNMNSMGMQTGMNGMSMHQMPMQGGMNGMPGQGVPNGLPMQGGMNGMGMQGGMNGMGMQGGMNGMGMQGGMNGMGMQGGMNGMGMQGGANGMGMQGGMNGMGMQGGMNGMSTQGGMNGMGMQGGMNGMGMVQQPAMGGHATQVVPGGGLQLRAVGGFKDMGSAIHDLPEVTIVSIDDAGNRLFALKSKLNELQAKHDSYKTRQVANGGVAVASALFTFGTSLLVQGPAAVHQHNRMQTIKRAMGPCLEQINILRDAYGSHATWPQREATVTITEKIFSSGINRNDLKGGL